MLIGVLGTGGTIAMRGAGPHDSVEYADSVTVAEVDEVLAGVPGLDLLAEVVPIRYRALKSNEETVQSWVELAARVAEVLEEGIDGRQLDGIVITHGTTTMEEVAYFLHLTVPTRKPLVLVGAQRPPTALGTDAGISILRGVQVACSPAAAGAGALVVMNDEIHSARDVTKQSNHRLDAFWSPTTGPLGYAEADLGVGIYRLPTRRHTSTSRLAGPGLEGPLPRVEILNSYAGADGVLIRAAAEAGARGLVLAAMPPGLLTPAQDDAVAEVRGEGVEVVLATRGGGARMLRRRSHRDRGIIVADDLTPQAARVLLTLSLARTDLTADLQTLFDEH
jgi:L-asparaginase